MLKVVNKRQLHHLWTKIRPLSSYYFFIAAVLFFIVGLVALRQNNLTALKLRDNVAQVDEQNGDVEAALRTLREHIYSHMNSNLAGGSTNIQQPVQLKFRYERLLSVEKARVSQENEKIYNDAQIDCERRFPAGLSGSTRIPCIEEYVSSRSVKEQVIPDSLYKFDFISPMWSADLAGMSLLFSAVFLLLFVVRLFLDRWIHQSLSDHQ